MNLYASVVSYNLIYFCPSFHLPLRDALSYVRDKLIVPLHGQICWVFLRYLQTLTYSDRSIEFCPRFKTWLCRVHYRRLQELILDSESDSYL